ncbi:MAG: GldG family protein [Sphingopyxis sp.]|nr:GldG family protein [Sphingopyxis sp.]
MIAASRRSALRALTKATVAAIAVVAMAWVAGGQALLGRIDPALAVPLILPPMLLIAMWQRDLPVADRCSSYVLAIVLLAMAQAMLAALLAGSVSGRQLLMTAVVAVFAAAMADLFARWRPRFALFRWAAGLALAVGWFIAGHALLAVLYRPSVAASNAPPVTMMTGLPLRWSGGGDMAAMIAKGAQDDPALARLTATGPVSLVDSLADRVPSASGGTLLVAHPRALAPRELVAIDAFVRGGGQAVLLADALSGWPARHPIGDPRNAPVTSLLTPLLDHWGVGLGAAPATEGDALPIDVAGARLRLFRAGRLGPLPPHCRAYGDRRVARCGIGQGTVWLIGDADLLFAALWQPLVPRAPHLRQADTMEWLSARLWPGAGQSALRPIWIRARNP